MVNMGAHHEEEFEDNNYKNLKMSTSDAFMMDNVAEVESINE